MTFSIEFLKTFVLRCSLRVSFGICVESRFVEMFCFDHPFLVQSVSKLFFMRSDIVSESSERLEASRCESSARLKSSRCESSGRSKSVRCRGLKSSLYFPRISSSIPYVNVFHRSCYSCKRYQ